MGAEAIGAQILRQSLIQGQAAEFVLPVPFLDRAAGTAGAFIGTGIRYIPVGDGRNVGDLVDDALFNTVTGPSIELWQRMTGQYQNSQPYTPEELAEMRAQIEANQRNSTLGPPSTGTPINASTVAAPAGVTNPSQAQQPASPSSYDIALGTAIDRLKAIEPGIKAEFPGLSLTTQQDRSESHWDTNARSIAAIEAGADPFSQVFQLPLLLEVPTAQGDTEYSEFVPISLSGTMEQLIHFANVGGVEALNEMGAGFIDPNGSLLNSQGEVDAFGALYNWYDFAVANNPISQEGINNIDSLLAGTNVNVSEVSSNAINNGALAATNEVSGAKVLQVPFLYNVTTGAGTETVQIAVKLTGPHTELLASVEALQQTGYIPAEYDLAASIDAAGLTPTAEPAQAPVFGFSDAFDLSETAGLDISQPLAAVVTNSGRILQGPSAGSMKPGSIGDPNAASLIPDASPPATETTATPATPYFDPIEDSIFINEPPEVTLDDTLTTPTTPDDSLAPQLMMSMITSSTNELIERNDVPLLQDLLEGRNPSDNETTNYPIILPGNDIDINNLVVDSYAHQMIERARRQESFQSLREGEAAELFERFFGYSDPDKIFAHDLEHFGLGFTFLTEQQIFPIHTRPRTRDEYWDINTVAKYIHYAEQMWIGTAKDLMAEYLVPGAGEAEVNKINKMLLSTGILHTVEEEAYRELLNKIPDVTTEEQALTLRKELSSLLTMAVRINRISLQQLEEGVTVANAYRAALEKNLIDEFGSERARAVMNFDFGEHVPELSEAFPPSVEDIQQELGNQELTSHAERDYLAPHRHFNQIDETKLTGMIDNSAVDYAISLLPDSFSDEAKVTIVGVELLQSLTANVITGEISLEEALQITREHFDQFNTEGKFTE